MKNTNVKFLRQDEINDVFEYQNERGEVEYSYFPRTMEMNVEDVKEHLN